MLLLSRSKSKHWLTYSIAIYLGPLTVETQKKTTIIKQMALPLTPHSLALTPHSNLTHHSPTVYLPHTWGFRRFKLKAYLSTFIRYNNEQTPLQSITHRPVFVFLILLFTAQKLTDWLTADWLEHNNWTAEQFAVKWSEVKWVGGGAGRVSQ